MHLIATNACLTEETLEIEQIKRSIEKGGTLDGSGEGETSAVQVRNRKPSRSLIRLAA